MRKHIPNLITSLNLLCGCIAAIFAVRNNLELTALFVLLGIVFDFFDGFAARLLKVQSAIGVQLDSLADMVTSGLVPGIVMFQLLSMSQGAHWTSSSLGGQSDTSFFWTTNTIELLPFFGFLITIASAYRLAKFNIDENQVTSFIGLPTPANTLLILSLPMILWYHNNAFLDKLILNQWFLIGITLLSSYLLNAKIPLFALKFKNWSFKDNSIRYIFLIVSIVFIITLQFLAIPAIIAMYIFTSLISK